MSRSMASCVVRSCAALLFGLGGCTAISVNPDCPSELEVGQSGNVWGNVENPGSIPTFKWVAVPSDAGTFADPAAANTTFRASKEGDVVLRLTAIDGLYQSVGECQVTVGTPAAPVDASVVLTVDPDPVVVGETAILFCASTGQTEATTRTLDQTAGTTVTLSPLSEGVATFVATEVGDLTFRCTGATDTGAQTEPSNVTVSVVAAPDDNDNTNDNDDSRGGRDRG